MSDIRRTLRRILASATFAAALCGGLTPSVALAAEPKASETGRVWYDDAGDRHEVLWDGKVRDLPGSGPQRYVRGSCPQLDYPYLHEKTGTGGRSVGQGFIVWDDTFGTEITELPRSRTYQFRTDGVRVVTGTEILTAYPIWNINAAVHIEMVCTFRASEAWRA